MALQLSQVLRDMTPLVAMTVVQICYAGMDILFKLANRDGANVKILVAYRLIFATIFMFPLAFIFQRKERPESTWRLLLVAFLSGSFGAAAPNILLAEGLVRTTATFVSASSILIPLLTFVLAAIIRMESVQLGSNHGKAKVIGTLLGVGGALVFVLYKGKEIHLWSTHIHLRSRPSDVSTAHNTISIFGAFLVLGSMIFYALWILMQVKIGKKLGGFFWNISLMNMMGTLVSIIVALCARPDLKEWRLGWNIRLLTSMYSGVIISGISFAVTVWCVESNGPVFASMFSPVRLVVVAFVASLMLQEKIYIGSIVGTIVIVGGLYLVLWAKKKETKSMSDNVETNTSKTSHRATEEV